MFSFIAGVIGRTGLWGVFLLMLAENVLPAIPSELILPMAGFEASRGAFGPVPAALLGALGSSLGGISWYAGGRWLGYERTLRLVRRGGRWAAVTPEELERANRWFRRWSSAAVLIGRMLPGLRGIICIPAGINRMPFWKFLFWSSLGAAGWSALLVWAGYVLGRRFAEVGAWLNPVTDAVVGLLAAFYLWRVIRPRRHPPDGEGVVGTSDRAATPGRRSLTE